MGLDTEWAAARQAIKAGQFETAIEHLTAITEQDDEDADAFCYLGACFGQLGRHLEAEFNLSRATELNPHSAVAHYNLGRCFEQRHLMEQAIRSYENALRANREYAAARKALERLHVTLSPDLRSAEEAAAIVEAHEEEAKHLQPPKANADL